MIASLAGNSLVETEFGVVISTGAGGLNFVARMKKLRIRKAMSTNGVISVSVLFLGIFTLGMLKNNLVIMRFGYVLYSITPASVQLICT
jgi:hypothetical protein